MKHVLRFAVGATLITGGTIIVTAVLWVLLYGSPLLWLIPLFTASSYAVGNIVLKTAGPEPTGEPPPPDE